MRFPCRCLLLMAALMSGTLLVVNCGGGEEEAITAEPTETVEPGPTRAATPEQTAEPSASPTQERGPKPVITPAALPGDLEDNFFLTLTISTCQDVQSEGYESLFSDIPALEEVRTEFLQVTDNLCTQGTLLIYEGASDEALMAVAEDVCAQMTSLLEYVGEPYLSLEACKEITGDYLLELKAMGVPGAP